MPRPLPWSGPGRPPQRVRVPAEGGCPSRPPSRRTGCSRSGSRARPLLGCRQPGEAQSKGSVCRSQHLAAASRALSPRVPVLGERTIAAVQAERHVVHEHVLPFRSASDPFSRSTPPRRRRARRRPSCGPGRGPGPGGSACRPHATIGRPNSARTCADHRLPSRRRRPCRARRPRHSPPCPHDLEPILPGSSNERLDAAPLALVHRRWKRSALPAAGLEVHEQDAPRGRGHRGSRRLALLERHDRRAERVLRQPHREHERRDPARRARGRATPRRSPRSAMSATTAAAATTTAITRRGPDRLSAIQPAVASTTSRTRPSGRARGRHDADQRADRDGDGDQDRAERRQPAPASMGSRRHAHAGPPFRAAALPLLVSGRWRSARARERSPAATIARGRVPHACGSTHIRSEVGSRSPRESGVLPAGSACAYRGRRFRGRRPGPSKPRDECCRPS